MYTDACFYKAILSHFIRKLFSDRLRPWNIFITGAVAFGNGLLELELAKAYS